MLKNFTDIAALSAEDSYEQTKAGPSTACLAPPSRKPPTAPKITTTPSKDEPSTSNSKVVEKEDDVHACSSAPTSEGHVCVCGGSIGYASSGKVHTSRRWLVAREEQAKRVEQETAEEQRQQQIAANIARLKQELDQVHAEQAALEQELAATGSGADEHKQRAAQQLLDSLQSAVPAESSAVEGKTLPTRLREESERRTKKELAQELMHEKESRDIGVAVLSKHMRMQQLDRAAAVMTRQITKMSAELAGTNSRDSALEQENARRQTPRTAPKSPRQGVSTSLTQPATATTRPFEHLRSGRMAAEKSKRAAVKGAEAPASGTPVC